MPDALLQVPARRHPLQLTMAAWCVISGAGGLATGVTSVSIAATLPAALFYAWSGGLAFGGLLVLWASIDRDPLRALYLELVAHLPLAVLCLTYAGAVIVTAGTRGILAIGLGAAGGIGFGIRAVQVMRTMRKLHHLAGPDG